MNKQEADERCKEISDLIMSNMRTSESISEAYQKLFYFYCDWMRVMKDVVIKEIH